MQTKDRIRFLRISRNMSQEELAHKLGYKTRASICRIENGSISLPMKKLAECAQVLDTSVDYLVDGTEPSNCNIVTSSSHIYEIPIFASVSAGFGVYANSEIVGYEKAYIENPADAEDTMFVIVSGDSMEPKIEDHDLIQVRRQTSVDNGDFGVVIVDETEALVKQIFYGATWIELRSLNPNYPPTRYEGKDVVRLRVVGKVQKIIKTL